MTALAERPGRFAAAGDLGGDPDPLRHQDLVAELAEPAKAWWLARLGDPLEAARVIVFLGSPAASYITGASLEVSGGVSRHI